MNDKEEGRYFGASSIMSLIIHIGTVPWILAAVDKWIPKGWWTYPLICSILALSTFSLMIVAALIMNKLNRPDKNP